MNLSEIEQPEAFTLGIGNVSQGDRKTCIELQSKAEISIETLL
jgi:hypothetical protein